MSSSSKTSNTTKHLFLWAAPRVVGTAFEFAISTLPNTKTFHEPFCFPFHDVNPLEWDVDLHSSQPKPHRSYEDVITMVSESYHGKDVVFVKELAKYMRNKFDILLEERMLCFSHSFLIRHPIKSVLSIYNKEPLNLKKWYESNEIGYNDLYDLYHYLNQCLDISPVVIEADELLMNPEKMMEAYCIAVGITYREGMTKWESNSMDTQEFRDQKYYSLKWSDTALKSSGLMRPDPMPVVPEGLMRFTSVLKSV